MKRKILALILSGALLATLLSGCSSTADSNTTQQTASETDAADAADDAEEEAVSEEKTASAESSDEETSYSQDFFAMDTYMSLTAYGAKAEEAVLAAVDEINRLDALLSTGDEDSEIYQLNANGGGVVSDETAYLIMRSMEVYESTGGLYDITIYPVMDLWGFTHAEDVDFAVPEASVLEEYLANVNASELVLEQQEDGTYYLTIPANMQIDLGGIVKGYADDQVTAIFESYGITGAVINLGGDVHVMGTKTDGSSWRVGIQDPEDSSGYLGGLALSDLSVVTSGGYERYFDDEETGIRYHHIIDPRTGYSAYNGLISVSVISEDGALADALSTSIFIMGTEAAIAYCQEHCVADGFDVLLEDEDGMIYITDNIEEYFIDLTGDTTYTVIETH